MINAFDQWSFRQKSRAGELIFLLLLVIIIPLSVGLQIWPKFSFTLSLVLVNLFQLPVILLLYKIYLPRTVLNRRTGIFFLLLPLFLVVYDLNARAATLLVSRLSFIPEGYRANLRMARADQFPPVLIQNLDYTFLLLLATAGFLYIRESLRRQHALNQLQADKLRLELEGLKAQIQPHFFFNTLNNLYALSLQNSPRTSVMIANLSGIMRYVLYEAQQPQVPLAKEIAFLHSFIDLERIRHTDEDSISFSVQGYPDGRLIEPLLFLPLVENCFKHSLQKRIPGNRVQLVLNVDEDEIVFQTQNLLAADVPQAQDGGIGLQNVRKRLDILYPGRHSFEISTENNRFTVTLTLQCQRHLLPA